MTALRGRRDNDAHGRVNPKPRRLSCSGPPHNGDRRNLTGLPSSLRDETVHQQKPPNRRLAKNSAKEIAIEAGGGGGRIAPGASEAINT